MVNLPSFYSYGNYNSDNYEAHSLCFTVKGSDFYFSYKTLIAFRSDKTGLVCQINYWGQTTGKHLNQIEPNKSKRVDEKEFNKLLAKV